MKYYRAMSLFARIVWRPAWHDARLTIREAWQTAAIIWL